MPIVNYNGNLVTTLKEYETSYLLFLLTRSMYKLILSIDAMVYDMWM